MNAARRNRVPRKIASLLQEPNLDETTESLPYASLLKEL